MSLSKFVEVEQKTSSGIRVHSAIAEQGKIYTLEGNHDLALKYFKHALEMAVQAEEPNFYIRHYLDCLLESLELKGEFNSVLGYCEQTLALLHKNGPDNKEAIKAIAQIYIRKGLILLKMGETTEGIQYLEKAESTMEKVGENMPLAQSILFMYQSGLKLDIHRIFSEQQRSDYFIIKTENVNRDKAMKLPEEFLH